MNTWTISRKHVLYTAIVQITTKETEEALDLCMIKVQKSKLIKIIRYDDDDRQTDRQTDETAFQYSRLRVKRYEKSQNLGSIALAVQKLCRKNQAPGTKYPPPGVNRVKMATK